MAIKLHVEAVQTVVPTKPTDPRQSFKVKNLSANDAVLHRRFHIILCYDKASEEDSGWIVAGRIKESLGWALAERPILAGRLRRGGDDDSGDFEIVSNDSGVRLVEAKADVKLAEFVELKGRGEVEGHELVFWEDVVGKSTLFSPLFYVQVTSFTCGGYSVGISCNLLLVDPFVLTKFLKKLANTMFSKPNVPQFPTFYLPNFGKANPSPALLMGSKTAKNAAQSVIFTIPSKVLTNSGNNVHENIAALCIDKAEHVIGVKMASNVSLFVKGSPNCDDDAKVDIICSREVPVESQLLENVNGLTCATTWDELGLDGICFNEGKKPVYVCGWINSAGDDEGFVMVIPSTCVDDNTTIVVTFT